MISTAWVIGLTVCAAGANLLVNPGFEECSDEKPAGWAVFVQPQEGAFGRMDERAHSGERAVMLHTPLPYPREPVNNWSQTVAGAQAGKTYMARGYLRTEQATEAALWLQCWRKDPWGVIRVVSSSTVAPVYGDKDWQQVECMVEMPVNADFLMLRCVLKGVGTAWFDDIEVTEEMKEKVDMAAPVAAKTVSAPKASATPAVTGPVVQLDAMGQEVSRLREANRVLAQAMENMQDANSRLMEELLVLREELKTLQGHLRDQEPPGTAPLSADTRVPPLVPHGEKWSNTP